MDYLLPFRHCGNFCDLIESRLEFLGFRHLSASRLHVAFKMQRHLECLMSGSFFFCPKDARVSKIVEIIFVCFLNVRGTHNKLLACGCSVSG